MNLSQDLVDELIQGPTNCTYSCPTIDITIYVKNWKHIEIQVSKEPSYPGIVSVVL